MDATPPEPPTAEDVGEFALSLIQAFLRTGYYLPEHPESQRAKTGLFERFAALARPQGEVAFILREDGGQPVVSIEGAHPKPLRLKDVMIRGMADTYNPRFVRFLERKELVSLSLLAAMSREEFSRFVDVMSEPSLTVMHEAGSRDGFVAALQERGISNISDGDAWHRKQAADLLVQIGREAAIALIQEIDEGGLAADAAVTAIRVLGEITDAVLRRPTVRVIEKRLADADPRVRRIALRGLGNCGDPRSLGVLVAAAPSGG